MKSPRPAALVLKTDRRGRVFTPRERREELLHEFDRSGLSAVRFAALSGIKYPTLITWLHARRKRHSSNDGVLATQAANTTSRRARFAQVVLRGCSASTHALRVTLPAGAVMEITSAGQMELAACLLQTLATGEVASC